MYGFWLIPKHGGLEHISLPSRSWSGCSRPAKIEELLRSLSGGSPLFHLGGAFKPRLSWLSPPLLLCSCAVAVSAPGLSCGCAGSAVADPGYYLWTDCHLHTQLASLCCCTLAVSWHKTEGIDKFTKGNPIEAACQNRGISRLLVLTLATLSQKECCVLVVYNSCSRNE